MPGTIQRANRQTRKPEHLAFSSTSYRITSLASTHTVRVEASLFGAEKVAASFGEQGSDGAEFVESRLNLLKGLNAIIHEILPADRFASW
jgi:hypothetical protein